MLVGEAPGRDEDIEGLPFVGRSGKLLDLMLTAIGLDRTKAYIANIIPWRPPGNRTPTPQETQICLPFIQRQIELVNPDVLVTLGNPSTQTLLSTREGIMRTRGHGSTTTPARAKSAPSPRSIRPICCARRPTSGWRGGICARSRRRWSRRSRPEPEVMKKIVLGIAGLLTSAFPKPWQPTSLSRLPTRRRRNSGHGPASISAVTSAPAGAPPSPT